jgi:hypothetical protein
MTEEAQNDTRASTDDDPALLEDAAKKMGVTRRRRSNEPQPVARPRRSEGIQP